jgi:hypothetical protein
MTTIAAASHQHLETTNESRREENTPLFLWYRRDELRMATPISNQSTPLFALWYMTYTTECRNKNRSTPQTKTVSVGYVVDLAIDKHLLAWKSQEQSPNTRGKEKWNTHNERVS